MSPPAPAARVAVAVNPASGQGRGAAAGEAAIAALQAAGLGVDKLVGVDAADLRRLVLAALAVPQPPDALVMVGGDGMVHLGVGACIASSVPLGIVAAGTGNDVARAVGLPIGDPAAAVRAIVTGLGATGSPGPRRVIDVIHARSDDDQEWWFAGVLAAGFDAVVNERANGWTWPSGRARYVLAMLRELPLFRARAYTVTLDGETTRLKAMLVAVGNAPSYGGGMKVVPDAKLDDGLLDVLLVQEVSTFAFLRIFPRVYGGSHVHDPRVEVRRGRSVTLEVEPYQGSTVVGYADGERLGPLPLTCTVLPGVLSVLGAVDS